MRYQSEDPDTAVFTARIADPATRKALREAITALEAIEAHCHAARGGGGVSGGKPSSRQPPGDRRALGVARQACGRLKSIVALAVNLHGEPRQWTDEEKAAIQIQREVMRVDRLGKRLVARAVNAGVNLTNDEG